MNKVLSFIWPILLGSTLFLVPSIFKVNSLPNELSTDYYFEKFFLQDHSPLVLDIRKNEGFITGYIPNSKNDPECSHTETDWISKRTTIILVGESIIDPIQLELCQRKYPKAVILKGGIKDWANKGYPLLTGRYRTIKVKLGCSSVGSISEQEECF